MQALLAFLESDVSWEQRHQRQRKNETVPGLGAPDPLADNEKSYPGMRFCGITELLELILLHLPMRDLLLAQRVNRQFHQVISSSLQLQRALYLDPAPLSPDRSIKPLVNPLLPQCGFIDSLIVIHGSFNPCIMSLDAANVLSCQDEDLIAIASEGAYDSMSPYYKVQLEVQPLCGIGVRYKSGLGGATCYSTGSWRKMYATQPPCAVSWTVSDSFKTKGLVSRTARLGELWSELVYSDYEPMVLCHLAARLAEKARRERWLLEMD